MSREKIESFIRLCELSELVDWMKTTPHLYQYIDIVTNRLTTCIENLAREETASFAAKFFDAVIHRDDASQYEFGLLEITASSIIKSGGFLKICSSRSIDHDTEIGSDQLYWILLFLDSYTIQNHADKRIAGFIDELSKELFYHILDCYIPCSNAELLVEKTIKNYPIQDILEHAHQTEWFQNRFRERRLYEQNLNMKEMLLLFQYTSDIFSHREFKYEFYRLLHRMYHNSYSYREMFLSIEKRYTQFFHSDTVPIMTEVLDLIVQGRMPTISDDESDLEFIRYFGKVPLPIFKCLVNDMSCLANFIPCRMNTIDEKFKSSLQTEITNMYGMHTEYTESDDKLTSSDIEAEDPMVAVSQIPSWDETESQDQIATESKKDSAKMNSAEKKIYKAYRTYKSAEEKIDSQLTKAAKGIERAINGDPQTEIIEGRNFTVIGVLKKILHTVGLFSIGKVKAIIFLVVRFALRKKTRDAERRKICLELETEIELITEKIEDARGDGNREAKYAMMRTKKELENALKRVEYGLEADASSLKGANKLLKQRHEGKL